jgi:hypothetical protein
MSSSGNRSDSASASGSGSGGRSTKIRNSLFGHREAEENDVDLAISILADHPFKTMKTEISKKLKTCIQRWKKLMSEIERMGRACVPIHQGSVWSVLVF